MLVKILFVLLGGASSELLETTIERDIGRESGLGSHFVQQLIWVVFHQLLGILYPLLIDEVRKRHTHLHVDGMVDVITVGVQEASDITDFQIRSQKEFLILDGTHNALVSLFTSAKGTT